MDWMRDILMAHTVTPSSVMSNVNYVLMTKSYITETTVRIIYTVSCWVKSYNYDWAQSQRTISLPNVYSDNAIVSPCKKLTSTSCLHCYPRLYTYVCYNVIIVTFSLTCNLDMLYLCPLLCHFVYTGSAMHAIFS